jgi:CubicO group peptidase (beta-lactamase class C family)
MTRSTILTLALAAVGVTHRATAQGIELTSVSPPAVALDSTLLRQATDAAGALPALTSLLVWRNGGLAYEQYFHGGSRDAPVNVKSVSKSFLSALVGIALAELRIKSLDQPVAEVLPEYYPPAVGTIFAAVRVRSDSLRRRVTLRHLLTMSGGLAWDESNAMLTYALLLSGNPGRFAAELPVLAEPGAGFNYATASTHLLAAALARLTGTTNLEYGRRLLFGPANIAVARWDADAQGVNFGGSEMFFTPREMTKLGILYLRGGRVGDRQVVPASWVAESIRKQYDVTAPTYRQMVPGLTGYGYLWWLRTSAGHEMAGALGLGGQFVLLVPSLDLVVAGTSALDGRNPGNERQFTAVFDLVDRFVVSAAR